jgi:gas vesicle protein
MSNTKTLLGFVAGAAVGALAGVLLAPDSGSNTRKKISSKAEDITGSLKTSYDDFISKLKNAYNSSKEDAEDIKENVKTQVNTMKADVKANLS